MKCVYFQRRETVLRDLGFLASVKTSGGPKGDRRVWWFRQTIGACITQPRGLPASAESWHPFQGSDDNFQARARSRILGLAGSAGGSLLQPTMWAEHRIAKNPRETFSLSSWNQFLEQLLALSFPSPFPIRTPSCVPPGCNYLGNPVIPFATAMTRVHVCFNVVQAQHRQSHYPHL
jgi:hypothetical protein